MNFICGILASNLDYTNNKIQEHNLYCNFFDLQINGYAGVDFNHDSLTLESFRLACEKLKENGVKGILATIITADIEVMKNRIKQIVRLRQQDKLIKEIIYGIHIEGPFLNDQQGFRGAHPIDKIVPADTEKMNQLIDAGDGLVRIVTLAPEVDQDFKTIKMLKKKNIVVAAGHTDASLDELKGAIEVGLNMFTHFGNGCPNQLNRHNNILQRVLALREKLWICFIADGFHVPFYALQNYLALTGYEKSIIVTDAMAAACAPAGKYTLAHIILEVGNDRIVREPCKPNFAGSAITMAESKEKLMNVLGISKENVEKMTYINPIRAIKL